MLTSHRPLTVIEDGGLTNLSPVMSGHAQASGLDALTLQAVRESLRDRMSATLLDPVAPASVRDPEVLRVLRAEIGHQVEAGYGPLRHLPTDEHSLLRLFQEALGWGPAQPYLDDERIQEVKIIGDLIMVQEEGADFSLVAERFQDPRQALDRAMLLAARLNVPLDRSRPQDTLPLAHGTRMHVTIPPCTPDGTGLICIRRGRRYAWVLDDLLRRRACDQVVGDLLRLLVRAGCSFIIAGETGCGKTALLEALVNSWPGEPHVITIEDNTLEINVRHRAWTRELVQTAVERGAFGRAAREVLRQTPSLVAPGETRADEAGAILAVAVSGHAVVTTIHARSAARAVSRFADCAAMPGAYIYEGRRDHALEDTCDNFQVVIHLEKVSGRRYIDEILLLDGVEAQGERLRPRFVPLARVKHTEGEVTWQVEAIAQGDRLVWQTKGQTPEALQRRFELLQLRADVRAAATTHAAVSEAIARASAVTRSGDATQALAILRRAWSDRRDQRLVTAAQRVLELDLETASTMATQSRQAEATILAALGSRRWPDARAAYGEVMADLAIVAAHSPAGGWEHLERTIVAGEDRDYLARSQIAEARLALTQGRARDAVDLLTQCDPMALSKSVALETLATRRDALTILHAAGEIGGDALGPVQAALEALTT